MIRDGAAALQAGGRFLVLDLKEPDSLPLWLIRQGVHMMKPFGVSLELAERHPWESVERHLKKIRYEELYRGFVYISVGEKT